MQGEIVRYRDKLEASGMAVIAFGAWSVVKAVLSIMLSENGWRTELLGDDAELMDNPWARATVFTVVGIFIMLILLFHIWLGKGAISESRGKRLKRPYIAVAVISLISTISSIVMVFLAADSISNFDEIYLSSLVVDISYLFALSDMVLSAFKLRRLGAEEA